MSDVALRLPRQNPRAFLALAGVTWLALYLVLAPASEALVAALPVDRASHLGGALQFFLYDTPKVLLLLAGVVIVMGMINSYFTPERTRALLSGRAEGVGNVMAADARHRHPVLLLLGGAAVHRLRAGGRAAGRDVLLPDLGADGQRGRAGAAVRPVRLEDRRPVSGPGLVGRHRRRLRHRPTEDGTPPGRLGAQHAARRRP